MQSETSPDQNYTQAFENLFTRKTLLPKELGVYTSGTDQAPQKPEQPTYGSSPGLDCTRTSWQLSPKTAELPGRVKRRLLCPCPSTRSHL